MAGERRFETFPPGDGRVPSWHSSAVRRTAAAHQLSSDELTVSGHGPDASEVVPRASTGQHEAAGGAGSTSWRKSTESGRKTRVIGV